MVDIVKQLTTDEKIQLLAGPNWWNTNSIDRLGIPAVRMSDGPNVRISYSPVLLTRTSLTLRPLCRVFVGHRTSSQLLPSVSQ